MFSKQCDKLQVGIMYEYIMIKRTVVVIMMTIEEVVLLVWTIILLLSLWWVVFHSVGLCMKVF